MSPSIQPFKSGPPTLGAVSSSWLSCQRCEQAAPAPAVLQAPSQAEQVGICSCCNGVSPTPGGSPAPLAPPLNFGCTRREAGRQAGRRGRTEEISCLVANEVPAAESARVNARASPACCRRRRLSSQPAG